MEMESLEITTFDDKGNRVRELIPCRNIHSVREVKDDEMVKKGRNTLVTFLGIDEGYVYAEENYDTLRVRWIVQ